MDNCCIELAEKMVLSGERDAFCQCGMRVFIQREGEDTPLNLDTELPFETLAEEGFVIAVQKPVH